MWTLEDIATASVWEMILPDRWRPRCAETSSPHAPYDFGVLRYPSVWIIG